jgi:L-alanine-DL-glutamate epimerase-like enolase superfamily enzyme
MFIAMEPGLTVYRHDSPGGRIVIITVDERNPGDVVARLQVERRADSGRQGVGEPPLIAEARGASREEVLTELQALATDDAELARRLARWTAMQRRPRSDTP